jgi:hypothetical protein
VLAGGTQSPVEAVDDELIRVDGDDATSTCVDRELREPAVVGAEVEHHLGCLGRDRPGDEGILGRQVARSPGRQVARSPGRQVARSPGRQVARSPSM